MKKMQKRNHFMYLHVGLRAIVLAILLPACMMIAIGARADETITGTVTDE